jgi:membrane fusion protein (multidrug efflux system)
MFLDSRNYSPSKLRHGLFSLAAIALAANLTACGKKELPAAEPVGPTVSVIEVSNQEIGMQKEFVARAVARRSVDIKAQVAGNITNRNFVEGAFVSKDQILFEIERAQYIAALDKAKANMSSAIARYQQAQRNLKRGKELVPKGYISKMDMDRLRTKSEQTAAGIKVAESALAAAQVNLDFTYIKAPFNGQVNQVSFNQGALVGPNSGPLVTLMQVDPIYVSFEVTESGFLTYLQKEKSQDTLPDLIVSLTLPNGSSYPENGKIDFQGTQVNQSTGTVTIRADFPNPDGIIRPGFFLKAIIQAPTTTPQPVIPQFAVQQNQQGNFVVKVSEDNIAHQAQVTMGRRIGSMWVVIDGVQAGDKLVVEGLQKVRNGTKVKPLFKNVDPKTGALQVTNTSDQAK